MNTYDVVYRYSRDGKSWTVVSGATVRAKSEFGVRAILRLRHPHVKIRSIRKAN